MRDTLMLLDDDDYELLLQAYFKDGFYDRRKNLAPIQYPKNHTRWCFNPT